jgi:hypothetical protein
VNFDVLHKTNCCIGPGLSALPRIPIPRTTMNEGSKPRLTGAKNGALMCRFYRRTSGTSRGINPHAGGAQYVGAYPEGDDTKLCNRPSDPATTLLSVAHART